MDLKINIKPDILKKYFKEEFLRFYLPFIIGILVLGLTGSIIYLNIVKDDTLFALFLVITVALSFAVYLIYKNAKERILNSLKDKPDQFQIKFMEEGLQITSMGERTLVSKSNIYFYQTKSFIILKVKADENNLIIISKNKMNKTTLIKLLKEE